MNGNPFYYESKDTVCRIYKGQSLIEFPENYTVIDLETTGFNPNSDDIVEISALRVRKDVVVDEFTSLINPGYKIPYAITEITNITNEMLSTAPGLEEILPKFIDFVGDDMLIGHNVNFDVNFIYDSTAELLNKAFNNNFIDTLRISRKLNPLSSHKLQCVAEYLNVDYSGAHRALTDCYITYECYKKMKEMQASKCNCSNDYLHLENIAGKEYPITGKICCVKGETKLKEIANAISNANGIYNDYFLKNLDYLILSEKKYEKFLADPAQSSFYLKAYQLSSKGKLKVISEFELYEMLGIPIKAKPKRTNNHLSESEMIKKITLNTTCSDDNSTFFGKTFVFTGTLEKMSRQDAMQCVIENGGNCKSCITKVVDYLVIGSYEYNAAIKGDKSSKQIKAEQLKEKGSKIEIISEDEFYNMMK